MRLLIVEDDPDGREMLAELFQLHAWDVKAVPTTDAAMMELRRGGFDVVISDEDLEGKSGSTMLCKAFDEGLLSNVGALMYTADPGRLRVPEGVRILRKPLGVRKLLDAAQALACEAPTPSPAAVNPRGDAPAARVQEHGDPPPEALGSNNSEAASNAIRLVLYVTNSPSSERALRNLDEVLKTTHPAHVHIDVRRVDVDGLPVAAADNASAQLVMAPVLVKTQPGREQRFVRALESPASLAMLIQELDAHAPASAPAAMEIEAGQDG